MVPQESTNVDKNAKEIRGLASQIKAMRAKRDLLEKGSAAHRKVLLELENKAKQLKVLQGK